MTRPTNEPDRRNQHGEPLCDECGLTIPKKGGHDFGGDRICHGCKTAYNRELSEEFGVEV